MCFVVTFYVFCGAYMTNVKSDVMPVTLENARLLMASGALRYTFLTFAVKGWVLYLQKSETGTQYVLYTERGQPRYFKTIDTGCRCIYDIGLQSITILMDQWQPDQLTLKE